LDNAHAPGRLQAGAEFSCLFGGSERANVGAIEYSVLTKIDAMNDWLLSAKDAWKFFL
jgi:hypothetical protein